MLGALFLSGVGSFVDIGSGRGREVVHIRSLRCTVLNRILTRGCVKRMIIHHVLPNLQIQRWSEPGRIPTRGGDPGPKGGKRFPVYEVFILSTTWLTHGTIKDLPQGQIQNLPTGRYSI